jgi:hypothetical protein
MVGGVLSEIAQNLPFQPPAIPDSGHLQTLTVECFLESCHAVSQQSPQDTPALRKKRRIT